MNLLLGLAPDAEQYREKWLAGLAEASRDTAIEAFGIEALEVDDEHLVMQMPIIARTRQIMGLLHGGVTMMLAETVASAHASWKVDLTERLPVGIEINGSHLRSASDGHLRAVGTVLRRSSSLIVHEVDLSHAETGRLLSRARVTNFYKRV